MQKLVLPLNNFKPTAGYKNPQYENSWGYPHYGIDCGNPTKNRKLYSMGRGTVVAAGLDGLNGKTTGPGSGCGYCLVIIYKGCYNHVTGETQDLVCTYMHMANLPAVKAGDRVIKGTYLGDYGNTGASTSGPHLHIQFDTDTRNPLCCTGLSSKGHNLLKRGKIDSTVNPCEIFHIGTGQTVTTLNSKWYDKAEFDNLPKVTSVKKAVVKTGRLSKEESTRTHSLF
jgi:murein DD-endopeptidase MepM/ murein hydrolase activator NlpD